MKASDTPEFGILMARDVVDSIILEPVHALHVFILIRIEDESTRV